MALFNSNLNSNLATEPILLWTNPNPENEFGNQTLDFDLTDYDIVLMSVKNIGTSRIGYGCGVKNNPYNYVAVKSDGEANAYFYGRRFNFNDSRIVFDYTIGQAGYSAWGAAIPQKIWGVKSNFNVF